MPDPRAIQSLRNMLNVIGDNNYHRRAVLPFGLDMVDSRLKAGGLRLNALHEIAAATPSLEDDAAASLFIAGIAARAWGPVLWVARRRDLFAPGLQQAGLAPERIIHVEARDDAEVMALMEEGLQHHALGAVIGEVRRAAPAATRRMQLAAEKGHTIALLMKRQARERADPFTVPSPAVTRWRIAYTPCPVPAGQNRERAQWHLSLVRQQGAEPFELVVRACDETGRIAALTRLRPQSHLLRQISRAAA